jgi:hypothetical protein
MLVDRLEVLCEWVLFVLVEPSQFVEISQVSITICLSSEATQFLQGRMCTVSFNLSAMLYQEEQIQKRVWWSHHSIYGFPHNILFLMYNFVLYSKQETHWPAVSWFNFPKEEASRFLTKSERDWFLPV